MGKNTALEVKDFHGRYFCGKIMAGSGRRNSGGGCGDCEMRAGILEDLGEPPVLSLQPSRVSDG